MNQIAPSCATTTSFGELKGLPSCRSATTSNLSSAGQRDEKSEDQHWKPPKTRAAIEIPFTKTKMKE